jgi:hypothetical protein
VDSWLRSGDEHPRARSPAGPRGDGHRDAATGDVAAARRAYYLFLAGTPQGCEDCYVPLLVTETTLEAVAASGRDTTVVLITTYERDSVWTVERGVSLAAADVAARERVVRLRGRRYRDQEIGPADVLRLLETPRGGPPDTPNRADADPGIAGRSHLRLSGTEPGTTARDSRAPIATGGTRGPPCRRRATGRALTSFSPRGPPPRGAGGSEPARGGQVEAPDRCAKWLSTRPSPLSRAAATSVARRLHRRHG